MAKSEVPAEFLSEGHWDAHIDALERNVAGLEHRVLELEGMPAAHPDQIKAAKKDVEHAKAELSRYQKPKESKPRAAAKESR